MQLSDITEERIERWIKLGIRQISYQDLKHAVENKIYADDILFNHLSYFTLRNRITKSMFKTILRLYWHVVERYLCNLDYLYRVLTENRPEFKHLLDSREARHWLYQCARRAYDKLYRIAWC
ncbi:MAG: hypothetical protein J7J91_08985 [Deltaproteobacteria bacterium]|nr:hypothetical protein [Deltaproteobacteria bacterium]